MYKQAKNFKFFNARQTPSSYQKQSEIARVFANINRVASQKAEVLSKDRYVDKGISHRKPIVVGSSLKLIEPQLTSPKAYTPNKPIFCTSTKNRTVIKLSSINRHKRASSLFSPKDSIIQDDVSTVKNNPEEAKKCKEMRFITDLAPYANRITKKVTSSHRKGLSMQLQESKQLGTKKELPLFPVAPDELKNVKSESYIVIEYPSKKIILSKKPRVKMQIASLTKIMTFYIVLQILKNNNINPLEEKITVCLSSTKISGTSAKLEVGEQYSIQQLLFGMMLPSGNDAASQLALWGGHYLTSNPKRKARIYAFVQQMNRYSCKLGLSLTNFCNPHGLTQADALSTTKDIATLCCVCWESQLFKRIVSCKSYTLKVKSQQGQRVVSWKNTNKLLNVTGFVGLKTGTTISAGPCLATAYQFRNKIYITVVLKAPKSISRFKETCEILAFSLQKLFSDFNQSERCRLQELKQASHKVIEQTYSEQNQAEQVKFVRISQVNRTRTETSSSIFRTTH